MSEPSPLALRCLVAGVAYAACSAVLLLRAPAPQLGRRFAALALLLYAADQLAYFGAGFAAGPRQLRLLPVLMSIDLVATAVIGIALVTWLLEGERERLLRAAELARQRGRAQECVYRDLRGRAGPCAGCRSCSARSTTASPRCCRRATSTSPCSTARAAC